MKTVRTLVMILAALPVAALAQQDRLFADGIDQHCYQGANQSVALWKQQGLSDAQVQKLFQQYLAQCSGADPATAAYVAAVNIDFFRLSRLVLSGQIAPDLYVGLVRDRERKMRAAMKSKPWLAAYAQGDADGDLIPDSMDKCPGTADLTRTDNSGCPDRSALAPQPNREQLLPVLNKMHLMTSPACDGAPFPELSAPLHYAEVFAQPPSFTLFVSTVSNQPANCKVLYEVQAHFSLPGQNSPVGPEDLVTVVFRSTEMLPNGGFQVTSNDTGAKFKIWHDSLNYLKVEFRTRAINGNGLSSGWSGWR